jgi:RNA recognition motif. (a.k.a. RRM, RBD, or RNP domain)
VSTGPALGWAKGTRIPPKERSRISSAASRNMEYVKAKDADERRKKLGLTHTAVASLKAGTSSAVDWTLHNKSATNLMYEMGGQSRNTKSGIGVASAKNAQSSVYVDNLPQTVTQHQLELLFSVYGDIKRVKVYGEGMLYALNNMVLLFVYCSCIRVLLALAWHHCAAAYHKI